MTISDLYTADEMIMRWLRINKNTSLSRLLRIVNEDGRYSVYSDYPILIFIVIVAAKQGVQFNRQKMNYAINTSKQLRALTRGEKNALLNHLEKVSLSK